MRSRGGSRRLLFSTSIATSIAATLAATLALSACAVGPDYVRPEVVTPTTFKEIRGWTPIAPADDVPRGRWWAVYRDADLDALEDAIVGNQSIAQAEAQFRAANAVVDQARAAYYPVISADGSFTRSHSGGGRTGFSSGVTTVSPLTTTPTTTTPTTPTTTTPTTTTPTTTTTTTTSSVVQSSASIYNEKSISLNVSWEVDLWGKVRRQVESQRATAEASASDLAGLVLSTQASVATDYFQLRQLDAQKQLLDDTIAAYQRSLDVTRNRYAGGVAARVDVAQAETQLKTTQAQSIDLGVARAQFEHAIALLLGRAAADFSIPVRRWTAFDEKRAPPVPVSELPSQLLERRPDIASSERRVVSANAQIGVAKAAYYPSLNLTAQGGYSTIVGELLTAPNRFWSLGPQLVQSLFDGGLRRAQTAEAVANYEANVANYRQTVLSGFVEVEDQLASLRVLEREQAVTDDALASARESVALTLNQYKAGTVSYINVVTVQATALNNERNAASIYGNRMVSSVTLIRALGGGWTADDLPRPVPVADGEGPRPSVRGD